MSVYHKDTRQKIKIKDKSRAKDKRQPPALPPPLPTSLKLRRSKKATVVKESYGGQRKEKDKRKPYLDFWTIEPSMFLSSPDSLIR